MQNELMKLHTFTHYDFTLFIIAETPEKAFQMAMSERLKRRFAFGQVLDATTLEHAISAATITLLNAKHSIHDLTTEQERMLRHG